MLGRSSRTVLSGFQLWPNKDELKIQISEMLQSPQAPHTNVWYYV